MYQTTVILSLLSTSTWERVCRRLLEENQAGHGIVMIGLPCFEVIKKPGQDQPSCQEAETVPNISIEDMSFVKLETQYGC